MSDVTVIGVWIGFVFCVISATVNWRRYRKTGRRMFLIGSVVLTAAVLSTLSLSVGLTIAGIYADRGH
jgi:hypothetical protein